MSEKQKRQPSTAQRLVALGQRCGLFHTPTGEAFAHVPVGTHREVLPIRSVAFKHWLARELHLAGGTVAKGSAMADALGVLEAGALFDGPERDLHLRVARHEGAVWVDLGTADWSAVRVDANGWNVHADVPILFRRHAGTGALPVPTRGGNLEGLRRFVRVTDADWPLLVVFIATALVPEIPHCVLVLHGEQGAAKSSASRWIAAVVDPNTPALRRAPRDEDEFARAASHSWLVPFDNLSGMPAWLSDGICRVATGDGFSKRKLYTDDDDYVSAFRRVVLVNGIANSVTRGDLLDRSLLVELRPVPSTERRPEAELDAAFEAARGGIFGALLDVLSGAMREEPGVRLTELPRMADVGRWGVAVERALEWEPGSFTDRYTANRASVHDTVLDAEPVAAQLVKFMEGLASCSMSPGEWLRDLTRAASEDGVDTTGKRSYWPSTPRGLSSALTRCAPSLRAVGLTIERGFTSDGKHERLLIVTRTAPEVGANGHGAACGTCGAATTTDGRCDSCTVAAAMGGR